MAGDERSTRMRFGTPPERCSSCIAGIEMKVPLRTRRARSMREIWNMAVKDSGLGREDVIYPAVLTMQSAYPARIDAFARPAMCFVHMLISIAASARPAPLGAWCCPSFCDAAM
jgi:hypothetical protein